MPHHLFAYGTLQPGLAPPEMASLVARLTLAAEASVPGRLYLLGSYPGAILDPSASTRIQGVIYLLPQDPADAQAVLAQLDGYEEFFPALPAASQFLRIQHTVHTPDAGAFDCWLYVYNRPIAGALLIEDGVFRGKFQ
jgi:gamma-glutamylcyclotransferase (GGCT)/AIG2-like uncharacterized protein YtfP